MGFKSLWKNAWGTIAVVGFVVGCGGGSADGPVLRADAEFDPDAAATAFRAINEGNPAVAQSFTVLRDGRLEEFSIVVTEGESADSGVVRITIQPVSAGGVVDEEPDNSLIDPILVNTSSLPDVLVDSFTTFDIGDEPGRDVLAGERYAIVVEFVSRTTSTDTDAIARVLGQTGDPFAGGAGATGELEVGFTNNTEDYFFRTFVLEDES